MKELLETVLGADAMEETEEYVARGRRFERLALEDLVERWKAFFKAWCRVHTAELYREFADAGAELRLRGEELPFDAVKAEFTALQLEIARNPPNEEEIEAFKARIRELLLQGRGRPTH
jgi:hypothetical protein